MSYPDILSGTKPCAWCGKRGKCKPVVVFSDEIQGFFPACPECVDAQIPA